MPSPAQNINAFDLKLLKALLNFKITKSYLLDLTTEDKRNLCKSYNEEGVLKITHNYLLKLWPRGKEISSNATIATLDQLCRILQENYRWYQFVIDVSQFRPEGLPDNKTYSLLNNHQVDHINKALEDIFNRYKNFDDFKNEIIEKYPIVEIKNDSLDPELLIFINKIYIELTTRKAAIPIDEDNDVIEEIYDSWYKLFCIVRNEMKLLPIKYFKGESNNSKILAMTNKMLNDTLRPHLTEHQARFRNWLYKAKQASQNKKLTPQELQKKYPAYSALNASMKLTNEKIILFSENICNLTVEK